MRTTAARGSDTRFDGRFLHVFRQAPQDGRVCVWHDSMPKVENMTRPSCSTVENSARLGLDPLPGTQQSGRIEISLDAAVVAHLRPAAVELDAPVEPDHVA